MGAKGTTHDGRSFRRSGDLDLVRPPVVLVLDETEGRLPSGNVLADVQDLDRFDLELGRETKGPLAVDERLGADGEDEASDGFEEEVADGVVDGELRRIT